MFFISIILPEIDARFKAGAFEINSGSGIHVNYTVFVYDSASLKPIHYAKIILKKDGAVVGFLYTNAFGTGIIPSVHPSQYSITVSCNEYRTFTYKVTIDKEHTVDSVRLHPEILNFSTQDVTVTADKGLNIQPIQMSSGFQLFDQQTYHPSPTGRINDLVQQNLIGAIKAPTGEVHIRGQHGEFSYYIDGIPVPLGVFGGLNEIVDSKVIDRITMMTGGFSAEYGGQMAAIMDIDTKIPADHFHLDFSTYGGSYLVFNGTKPFKQGNTVFSGNAGGGSGDTLGSRVGPLRALNLNGQSLALSNRIGDLGFFVSATRQETDHRLETPTPVLYNDYGKDYFLYGKLNYLVTTKDYLSLNLSFSSTGNEVPFNPALINGVAKDNQISMNAFQSLSYFHTFSSESGGEKNLFVGIFARQGGLDYIPGAQSPASFQFAGDSTNNFVLTENRYFKSFGLRTKYDAQISKEHKVSAGLTFTQTLGTDNFTSHDSAGKSGPSVNSDFHGSDFGLFVQDEYQAFDWLRIDAGLRYDLHNATELDLQQQFSPRLKINFFIDDFNTAYIYYGRLFMPGNIEGLRKLATNVIGSGLPTLPEKDNFYEFVFLHNFGNGLTVKTAAFYKSASPGIDDQTIGNSSVKTAINISEIRTTGIELGTSYSHPNIPLTGYLNLALIHAYGSGKITGGFLPIISVGNATDLDHDQRLSLSASINYQPKDWFFNLTYTFGSGLTNGNPNNLEYNTGLFDFNSGSHVSPYSFFNFSLGHTFHITGEMNIEPSLYINNLFDNDYLLKGAYFSGASWGDRRNVVLKLSVHI